MTLKINKYLICVSEKRKNVFESNNKIKFDVVGFKGIDLPDQLISKYNSFFLENPNRSINRLLTRSEIACALGHIDAMRKLVDDDAALGAIILEDDVLIDVCRFELFIKDIILSRSTENAIILLGGDSAIRYFKSQAPLGYSKIYLNLFSKFRIGSQIIGIPVDRIYGAYGYFIDKKAANFLVNNAEKLFDRADYLTTNAPYWDIKLFSVEKPFIFHIYENNPSIIGNTLLRPLRYGWIKSIIRLLKRHYFGYYDYVSSFKTKKKTRVS